MLRLFGLAASFQGLKVYMRGECPPSLQTVVTQDLRHSALSNPSKSTDGSARCDPHRTRLQIELTWQMCVLDAFSKGDLKPKPP